MVVEWTESAERDLEKIYAFYVRTASKRVAKKVINELLATTRSLRLGMYLGQEEGLLTQYGQGHRYLICRHVKVIYLPLEERALITHVFDTRRNPSDLK